MLKIQDRVPRRAYIILLRSLTVFWSVAAAIFIGAIITFVAVMPNDPHGWAAIRTAFFSFLPGVAISAYAAMSSARELRSVHALRPDLSHQGQKPQV